MAEIVDIVNESNFDILIAYGEHICKAVDVSTHRENLRVIRCIERNALNRAVKENVKNGEARTSSVLGTLLAKFAESSTLLLYPNDLVDDGISVLHPQKRNYGE